MQTLKKSSPTCHRNRGSLPPAVRFACGPCPRRNRTDHVRLGADDHAGFRGWKLYSSATAGGPYTQVGGDILFTAAQTTYTHQTQIVVPDNAETTLYFIVKAFDKKGNPSGPSNEVSHTFDFVGPPAPGNLNITLVVTVKTP